MDGPCVFAWPLPVIEPRASASFVAIPRAVTRRAAGCALAPNLRGGLADPLNNGYEPVTVPLPPGAFVARNGALRPAIARWIASDSSCGHVADISTMPSRSGPSCILRSALKSTGSDSPSTVNPSKCDRSTGNLCGAGRALSLPDIFPSSWAVSSMSAAGVTQNSRCDGSSRPRRAS